MTPHKQLNQHKPDEGIIGDCWRTSIACLLNLHPSEVPHFCDKNNWNNFNSSLDVAKEWLKSKGYGYWEFAFKSTLENILNSVQANAPDTYYILAGNSSNNIGHSVICLNDKIIHDPSIDNSGIIGPMDDGYYWIAVLIPGILLK
jgi:hypothetical protein